MICATGADGHGSWLREIWCPVLDTIDHRTTLRLQLWS
jgi:hypothetical protein